LVRLALESQGWQVVFANDIDADKARMYRDNWPAGDHLVVGDIHALTAERIPPCDLFTASFPCNDLSIAGRWEGLNGKQSSAFWGLVRILEDLGDRRPPLVLLENVVGFLMSRGGSDFEQALLALVDLGYAVDSFILNASRWTPQSRARLFVVGKLLQDVPENSLAMQSDVRPESLVEFINTRQHIRWDVRRLPALPQRNVRLADIVEDLPEDDPQWWNEERSNYLFAQMSERHSLVLQRMVGQDTVSYGTAFRRVRHGKSMAELRSDGIAGCLRTPRGGSGRQILVKAGRGRRQARLLTARECARLQGVPDDYHINVPLNQALFGFGDAVCVPAVAWIARYYLTPALNELRRPREVMR
jgi:DNA (cytosine-5)-methyltransferase 1